MRSSIVGSHTAKSVLGDDLVSAAPSCSSAASHTVQDATELAELATLELDVGMGLPALAHKEGDSLPDTVASEVLTAEYFDFGTTTRPVLIRDAHRLFAVVSPLLFYRSDGGDYSDDCFPRVFFPCAGYAMEGQHGLVKMVCRTDEPVLKVSESPPPTTATATATRATVPPCFALGSDDTTVGEEYTARGRRPSLDVIGSPPTVEDEDEDKHSGADPAYFVKAVLDEARDIFHDDPHLQRIASHFLCRFSIYDQVVISALLTESMGYYDSTSNSAVVNTIFDIVKRHISVFDDGVFKLKLRTLDIMSCTWVRMCVDVFASRHPPLPTPAHVFNQFVESMAMPDSYRRRATVAQKLGALRRQHMIASCMANLVYPKFTLEWDARKRAIASNEIFYAGGFRATKHYSDPIVHIASVGQVTATLLCLIRNMEEALGADYDKFVSACETCFVRGQRGEAQRKAAYTESTCV
jgi:hypothetical protein